MKVNLLLKNPGGIRSGFLNIDPFADGSDARVAADVSNLDHSVDAGELDELVALDVLNYFPGDQVDRLLDNWLSKLAYGGTITVGVVDVREVARALLANSIGLDLANDLLHGEHREPWQSRKCSLTLARLAEVLENKGYKILAKRTANFVAVVTAQRSGACS